ncbi:MAG: PQQ-dependent sugar dehydrogenase [Microthrixaceae bacterium]
MTHDRQGRQGARARGAGWAMALVLVAGACTSNDGDPTPGDDVPAEAPDGRFSEVSRVDADEATGLAMREDGTLLVGERRTGRILEVDPDSGDAEELATVEDLDAGLEQGGLLDLAVNAEGTVLVSFTDTDGDIVIDEFDAGEESFSRRWDGPEAQERANGGRMAVLGGDTEEQDTLLIGIGDLLEPDRTTQPDAANGKLLSIDDEGDASPWSGGFNNPFALGGDGVNTAWVADNAPGSDPERLLRVTAARSEEVASWSDTRVPSGLAVTDDNQVAICYFAESSLVLVDPEDPKDGTGPRLADDCRYGVESLGDGRLAYSTDTEVVVIELEG